MFFVCAVERFAYRLLLFVSLCAALPTWAYAEQPRLVKDLKTVAASSDPVALGTMDGYSYFRAQEPDHGAELWRSDGTPDGTQLFMDLWAGPESSKPESLAQMGDTIFFLATDAVSGRELWRTDGTKEGTLRLTDIAPLPDTSIRFGRSPEAVNDRLFFTSDSHLPGTSDLWVTDGTRGGTYRVRSISASGLTAVGDRVFFHANLEDGLRQLWSTDGSEAGTHLVSPEPDSPAELIEWNGRLFFSAEDSQHGREPWLSDGTASGTRLLKDIQPGARGSDPGACSSYSSSFQPVALGDQLFFSADDGGHGCELWVTDGTEQGTRLFLDAAPPKLSRSLGPSIAQDGRFFFLSFSRLWVTDGTDEGTRRLTEDGAWEPVTAAATRSRAPKGMLVSNAAADASGRRIFFWVVVYSDKWGTDSDLWTTDGTQVGTYLVSRADSMGPPWGEIDGVHIFPGSEYENEISEIWGVEVARGTSSRLHSIWPGGQTEPEFIADLGSTILFSADDGAHGRELWATDSTPEGTSLVLDVNPHRSGVVGGGFVAMGGSFYFGSGSPGFPFRDPFGFELWRSDGTAAGTYMVQDLKGGPDSSDPRSLTPVEDQLFFVAESGLYDQLWVTDGTRAGTRLVQSSEYDGLFPRVLLGAGEFAFFSTFETVDLCKLWRTDGSATGTRSVAELHDGARHACDPIGAVNDLVYFEAEDRLWRTDDTAGGTVPLLPPLEKRRIRYHVAAGDLFYFVDRDRVWSTDGSASGTKKLGRHFWGNLTPSGLGNGLYFIANDGVSGNSLWITDATRQGTRLVIDFRPAGDATYIAKIFAAVDGTAFFVVTADKEESGGIGAWLWKSDGTAAGTVPVSPLPSASVGTGVAHGNSVYFSAFDANFGSEPWRTDGTPRGTQMLADLNPGRTGSNPGAFTPVGNSLFFVATTAREGQGIWVLDSGSSPAAQIPKLSSSADLGESGFQEIAVLGSKLSLLDADSGAFVSEGQFAPSDDWEAVDLEWMPDTDGNGSADLAVLARWRSRALVLAIDGLTGEILSSTRLSRNDGLLELEVLPESRSGDEYAFVLFRKGIEGGFRISSTQIGREDSTSDGIDIELPDGVRAHDLEIIRASSRSGAQTRYGLAVLASSDSRAGPRVLTYDAHAGFLISDWELDGDLVPVDLEPLDTEPTSASKVVVLAQQRSKNKATIVTLDPTTGEVVAERRLKKKFSALDLETVPSRASSSGQSVGVLWVSHGKEQRVGVTISDALTGEKRATLRLDGIRRPRDFAFARTGRRQGKTRVAVLGDAACGERQDRLTLAVTLWDVDSGQQIACHAVE